MRLLRFKHFGLDFLNLLRDFLTNLIKLHEKTLVWQKKGMTMTSPSLTERTTSAITKRLLADHERMGVLAGELKPLLREICQRQASSELKKVQEAMHQFVSIMNTHSACEEESVFPALAKHHPLPVLEAEHDEIMLKRAALFSGILSYTFPESCSEQLYNQALEFFNLFERHMRKEEQVIFPLLEKSLSPEEKFLVLTQMEDIQSKARVLPTPEIVRKPAGFIRFAFPIAEPPTQDIQSQSLLKKEDLEVKTLRLKAGASLAMHWSPKQILLLLYAGKANWSSSDTILTLHAGEGILMDPRLQHALEAESDCHLLLISNQV
jgi:hemerythrin-like domain-containing protein/quercetin dioxygenase-like cupin family protein